MEHQAQFQVTTCIKFQGIFGTDKVSYITNWNNDKLNQIALNPNMYFHTSQLSHTDSEASPDPPLASKTKAESAALQIDQTK